MSLAIIPIFLFTQLVLFLPGLALLATLSRERLLSTSNALAVLFSSVGVLGYLAFWLYFENKTLGKSYSVGIIVVSLFVLLREKFRAGRSMSFFSTVRAPLFYLAVVGSLYLAILFVVTDPFKVGHDLMDWRFFSSMMAGDNIIPWIFAEKIYRRQPLIPFCCGDWLSSDRPPLQAGIFLFYWPLRLFGSPGLNYQLVASGLQCSWIFGIWSVLSAIGASQRRIIQVLGLLVPLAFFLFNTLYTWPKLLAATFILFAMAISITVFRERRLLTRSEAILGAVCVALAIMAHPGSIFSLPVFGLVLLVRRSLPLRHLALAALILAAFSIPWQLYQKYVDPPGNRLLKMHLAGSGAIDNRSFGQALKDSYSALPWSQILRYKWRNVEILLGPRPFGGFSLKAFHLRSPHINPVELERLRSTQKEYIWSALGFLNLGWLAAIYVRKRAADEVRYAFYLAGAVGINFALWCLLLFGPGQTIIAISSYADILLLTTVLALFLTELPGWIPLVVMLLEALNTGVVWLSYVPVSPIFVTSIQTPLLVFTVLTAAGLMFHFGRAYMTANEVRQDRPKSVPAMA